MHMEVDLDINHYDLDSLVALFKIPINFNVQHLKQAKKTVLAMHPDKSKLDKDYFLFFSKAYKILYEIYQFKSTSTNRNVKEYNQLKYADTRDDKEYDKQNVIDTLTQSNHFITTFNEMFDKHYAQKDHGYGDWLSSQEDIHNDSQEDFDTLKTKTRAIVVRQEVEGIDSYTGDVLGAEHMENGYGSSQYEDLRHAYTNALVLGVDERDFKEGYNSLNQLKQARYSQNVEPLSKEECLQQSESNEYNEDKINTSRAYRLIKEQENYKKANQEVWSSLLRISHNK
jgi:hypothetical protein